MFLVRKQNFDCFLLLFFTVVLFKGCNGCFQSDEYQNSSVKTGNTFYAECECSNYHDGVQKLKWLDKDNKIITQGPGTESNIYVEWLTDSANLHIRAVTKAMSGTYKCVTQHDGKDYVHTHNLHVYDPLTFLNTNDVLQYIVEGDDSNITCKVISDSTPIIEWFKDDIEVSSYKDKYKAVAESLFVYEVVKEDAGIYRCKVLNGETSEEIDKYIKVEVLTRPIITNLEAIPDTMVMVGEKLIIECKAEGLPQPEHQWSKTSAMGPDENENKTWIQEDNRIVFFEIQTKDAGSYVCFAFNSIGNQSKEITIEVLTPPEVIDFKDVTAVEGASVQISCIATGNPKPNITIKFKSISEKENQDLLQEIPNNALLQINRSHKGIYICNATNEIDFDSKTMYLTVLHKPYFEKPVEEIWGWNEKTIIISCEHDSNPISEREWSFQVSPQEEQLFGGKRLIADLNKSTKNFLPVTIDKDFAYGTYKCYVKNAYGDATKIIKVKEAFVPPSINNASVIGVTATSAVFSIDGPTNFEGPPVNGFKAEYESVETYNTSSVYKERNWAINIPYKLTNLRPNTTYLIKFAAINEVGAGVWSDYIAFDTLEKSAPEAPIFDEKCIGTTPNGNIELKWKAPDNNGEPIDYYSIRYCPSDDSINGETENLSACVEERLEPTTKLDLSRLEPNMTYYLELVAHNSEGNSTAASISVTVPVFPKLDPVLSVEAIIGIAVVVTLVCLFLLDLLFLFWRKAGILATCFLKKQKKPDESLNTRDKKGLLKDGGDSTDLRPNNGHKEYEYNKTTGVITGKHSSV